MTMDEALLQRLDPALLQDAILRVTGTRSHQCAATRPRPMGHVATVTGRVSTMRLSHVGKGRGDGRHKVMSSYDELPAGCILALQVLGDPGGGVIGDLVAHRLVRIGVLGAVVDGPVRDVGGILDCGFHVWAREVTLRGMSADELRVEIGCPVEIDGVTFHDGDLASAGRDGVCVVPADKVAEVLDAARVILAEEEDAHKKIGQGRTILQAYPTIRAS